MTLSRCGFRTVVFDLDGTLIDSVPDVAAAVNRLLADYGRPELSLDAVRKLVGEGATVLIERVWNATGGPITPLEVRPAVECYIEHYARHPAERTVLYPGVRQVLNELKEQGTGLAICSNKPYRMTRLVLEELGLAPLFSAVTGGDNVAHRKPDGRHILETLGLMSADPASAAYVGDSATDVAAARDARLPVVLVGYGYDRENRNGVQADRVIDDFHDLPDVLRELSPGMTTQ